MKKIYVLLYLIVILCIIKQTFEKSKTMFMSDSPFSNLYELKKKKINHDYTMSKY